MKILQNELNEVRKHRNNLLDKLNNMKNEYELVSKKGLEDFNHLKVQYQQEIEKHKTTTVLLEETKSSIVDMVKKTVRLEGKLTEERKKNKRKKVFEKNQKEMDKQKMSRRKKKNNPNHLQSL